MKEITIDGIIGWQVTSRSFKELLDAINENDDLLIKLSSPGGSVWQGLTIANLIRNHKGHTRIHLMGLAASMGSYIAVCGDELTAAKDAVLMIHEASTIAWGNKREIGKTFNFMSRLDRHLAQQYADATGKSLKEIEKLMEEETFYFGEEIVKEGFAKTLTDKNGKYADKTSAILDVQISLQQVKDFLSKEEGAEEFVEKAAALFGKFENKKEEKVMNKDELIAELLKHEIDVVALQNQATVSSETIMKLTEEVTSLGNSLTEANDKLKTVEARVEEEKIEALLGTLILECKSTQARNEEIYRPFFKSIGYEEAKKKAEKLTPIGNTERESDESTSENDDAELDAKIKLDKEVKALAAKEGLTYDAALQKIRNNK